MAKVHFTFVQRLYHSVVKKSYIFNTLLFTKQQGSAQHSKLLNIFKISALKAA